MRDPESPLKFGTSGVRGLAAEMTNRECACFARGFVRHLRGKRPLSFCALSGDFRSSTPRILEAIHWGLRQEGVGTIWCGHIATPALALLCQVREIPGMMVTGSHIPDDRNGIKFYFPWGEVLKQDEAGILDGYREVRDTESPDAPIPDDKLRERLPELDGGGLAGYLDRYLNGFPPDCLGGLQVAVYQHSSVSRDLLVAVLEALGARAMPLLRSPGFVAVDTEAVEDLQVLAAQVTEHRADALISTDGDGDRPLLLDEQGRQVRGDNLGILAASYLGAESAVVPVSSTTAVERSGWFRHVTRTRIGSPWVIEGMQRELESGRRKVVGWEANGGFLTASPITVPGSARSLTPLPTRDALLPILAVLAMARHAGRSVSGLVDGLPPVFTAGGIIRRFPQEQGRQIVDRFRDGGLGQVRSLLGDEFGEPEDLDLTDGARITFADGSVVHLRPSGNAPEFRCYTEAASAQAAESANRAALDRIRAIADEPEH